LNSRNLSKIKPLSIVGTQSIYTYLLLHTNLTL
jgi:hypothetical protein